MSDPHDDLPALDPQGWLRVAQLAELGVLASSLLHELRQPLFAIQAAAQLRRAQGRGLDADDLTTLLANLRHVDELLDHYSGFSRMGGDSERFDLRIPLRHASAMLALRCRQEGVQIDLAIDEAPLLVQGRPTAVRQVLVNLIQNAIDAVSEAPERTIRVGAHRVDGRCRVDVWDSGPGVAPELRERLFQPFFTTKPEGRGTGLGLYIARRLVEEMGGTVQLDSHAGMCVVVDLPLAE